MSTQAGSQMQFFIHDGFDLAFLDRQPESGEGDPVLM
ncbi:alpha/beta hydrolase, partial [Mesorhizobium sp. M7A.T.Ca.US.000.02.1.1]